MCDALFAVLAFWVFPVLLPRCGLHRPRRGSDARRTQLPLFLLLSLGIGVAVIAWSITVREDLGSPSPRQHTRYLEPLLLPLLPPPCPRPVQTGWRWWALPSAACSCWPQALCWTARTAA